MGTKAKADGEAGKGLARCEALLLVATILAVWAYVIARAILVPFIQDEGNSFWFYAYTGEFLPFLSHTDAGNHFLNSLFGALGYRFWGYFPLGIRWGSVLSFPIYAWGCWAFSRNFTSILRWCTFLALALCPFLLDFFALFRGYGPAMAGWIWALYGLAAYSRQGRTRELILMVTAASLSVLADLSLLPTAAVLLLLSVLLSCISPPLKQTRNCVNLALYLTPLVAVLAISAIIAFDLRSKGLLYLGGTQGFMHVTVQSLANAIFNHGSNSFIRILVAPIFICTGVAIWQLSRTRIWRSTFVLLIAVLAMDVLSRWAMAGFIGTNYPQDRSALHFIPLYILIVAHTLEVLGKYSSAWRYMAILLLVFPARTLQTLNFSRMVDSYEKTFPLRFMDEVEVLRRQLGRPLLLSGSEHFAPAWAFHQIAEGYPPIVMRTDLNKNDPDDVRIVNREILNEYLDGYQISDSSSSGAYLLVRDTPCVWTAGPEITVPSTVSNAEWIHLPISCPRGASGVCLIFDAQVQTEDPVSHIMLVTEVLDSTGAYIRYDAVELRYWVRLASGTRIEVARYVQPVPPGGKCGFYLWNQRRTRYHLSNTHIREIEITCP
ncbi:MAG: hypothetical protein OZ932_00790 [Flavobacteriia bacterium]|nr:hypothetical protein [Flavobacteriia bacterium]